MKRVLIDTNALIRFLRGDDSVFSSGFTFDGFYLSSIVIGEYLIGIENTKRGKVERLMFEKFMSSTKVKVISVTPTTAEFYARIFSNLKTLGRSIPMNDIWIAAQALEHGAPIWTFDVHFSAVSNLIVLPN